MVDLKVVNDSKGGYVYRDHLPLLGQNNPELKAGNVGYQVADQVSGYFPVVVFSCLQIGNFYFVDVRVWK